MDSMRKAALFQQIFALEEDEDDHEFDDDIGATLSKSNAKPDPAQKQQIEASESPTIRSGNEQPLQSVVSLPGISSDKSEGGRDSKIVTPCERMQTSGPFGHAHRADVRVSMGRGIKRRRLTSPDPNVKLRTLFKGFIFFFVPNDGVDRAQAFKIRKAREFGAEWAREWRVGITHILAADRIIYEDLMAWLNKNGVDRVPPETAIVNESYVPWCIELNRVLDPHQPQYFIKGYQERNVAATPRKLSSSTLDTDRIASAHISNEAAKGGLDTSAFTSVPSHVSLGQGPYLHTNPPRNFDDELSRAIEEAQATKEAPIDLEDDIKGPSPVDSDDDDDTSQAPSRPNSKDKSFSAPLGQHGFSCMSKHDGTPTNNNPNRHIIDVLQQMASYYDRVGDHWRTTSYRKAISTLMKQDQRIMTKEQALKLPNIGTRLAEKIEEIAMTNRLRRLENTRMDPTDSALQLLMGIYGVGFSQAQKWVDQGYRTIESLLSRATLTTNQRIGIDHFDDFNSRIPRTEMQQHDAFVRGFAAKVDKELQLTIGGSYRRGAANSGDIDFIVTKPHASASLIKSIMLDRLIPSLLKIGYLKVALAGASSEHRDGGSKWHGACALINATSSSGSGEQTHEPPWRRIDFLFVPWQERGAAFIYFTGNDIFNRSIRLLARKKGMRLNQHGLHKDVMRGPKAARLTEGTLVESADERKIFDLLGVPWREPWERIC